MIALFCGSRDWTDEAPIREAMERLVRERGLYLVIHGAQRGADDLAGKVASSLGLQVMEEPAEWSRLGPSAGPVRNEAMLGTLVAAALKWGQPVQCRAFHVETSLGRGTRDMVARCVGARVRTAVHLPPLDPRLLQRVSGDCACRECGLPYRRHPEIASEVDSNGEPFLTWLCGRIGKL